MGLSAFREGVLAGNELACEREVGFGALRLDVVEDHRFAVAWGFSEPDIPGNDGRVDAVAEEFPDLPSDLLGQVCGLVNEVTADRRLRSLP